MKHVIGLLIFVGLAWLFHHSHDKRSLAEQFPGAWQEELHLEISKSLVAAGALDCGEYKWRASADSRSEFLVVCSRDGRKWKQYLVLTASKRAIGPSPLDSSIAFSL